MDHDEIRRLLDGYLDGELDLVRNLELEAHLENCPACVAAHNRTLSLRKAVNAPGNYYRAPESLQARISAGLRQQQQAVAAPAPKPARRSGWSWYPVAIAASVAVASVALWMVSTNRGGAGRALDAEIAASHVRSLLPGHLTDVASTDTHNVKPWFAGKVDFSPRVIDLAPSGFPLVGGRLDYIGSRTVAVLVYQRRQHVINVFVWPSTIQNEEPKSSARQGYNSVRWIKAGLEYWAISDLNEAELKQFVQLANAK